MKRMIAMRRTWSAAASAALLCLVGGSARAAVLGPYTTDANTLHLYHLDEPVGSASSADAAAVPQNMNGVLQGATLGNGSFAGFGSSLDTSANALLPANAAQATPPHRPILLAAPALSTTDATDGVVLAYANPASGAFTFEAIVKFDPSFDPAATNYRNVGATNGGAYPMEIFSGEGEGAAARLFQFRIDQIGIGTGVNVGGGPTGTTGVRLEFANLRGIVLNQALAVNLPTTGVNAINNTDWFHLAVAYNGTENTANNISFYWTKVDPAATTANLLGQGQLNSDPIQGLTAFAIGNEARDTGSGAGEGESFVGRIDEVRISSVARTADQFIFGVPEPTTGALVLVSLSLLGAVRRRAA